jgi:hypothetical protein
MSRVIIVVLASLLTATPALAQRGLSVSASGRATWMRMRSASPTSRDEVRGLLFGGEGRLGVEFLSLRLGYAQGTVEDDPGPARALFVEGFALLGVEPAPGLELTIGPHIRSRLVDGIRQRLVVWRLRGRFEGPILSPMVHGYVEATAGRPDRTLAGFTSWWGGAVGLVIRPGDGRIGLGASYAIDEARGERGERRETIEGLTFSLSAYLQRARP